MRPAMSNVCLRGRVIHHDAQEIESITSAHPGSASTSERRSPIRIRCPLAGRGGRDRTVCHVTHTVVQERGGGRGEREFTKVPQVASARARLTRRPRRGTVPGPKTSIKHFFFKNRKSRPTLLSPFLKKKFRHACFSAKAKNLNTLFHCVCVQ